MTSSEEFSSGAAQSSGHLLADRRYDYAMAAREDGDHAAAVDLLEQTLELVPNWAAAWFALGEMREALHERDAALAAFLRSQSLSGSDPFGASLRAARLQGQAPAIAPAAYVRALFDQYAPKFDAHLVDGLDYRAPQMLRSAVEKTCAAMGRPRRFSHAVDLGCGTGLAAKAMHDVVGRFSGVDLSPAMVRQAQQTGLYDTLAVDDLVSFMRSQVEQSADLVLAADVFVYMGDLADVFDEAARVLQSRGLFCFTVQASETHGFVLGDDLRFGHSQSYLEMLAARAQFEIAMLEKASTRKDRGIAMPGLIGLLVKP